MNNGQFRTLVGGSFHDGQNVENDALAPLLQSFDFANHLEPDFVTAQATGWKDLSGKKGDFVRHAVLRVANFVDAAYGNTIAGFVRLLRGHSSIAFALPRRAGSLRKERAGT